MRLVNGPHLLGLAVLAALQLACSTLTGAGPQDTAATLDALYTASALTVAARMTAFPQTATPGLPPPTVGGTPSTPIRTSTPVILSPVATARCDAATFVTDVSYRDGTVVTRGSSFTKTWRLRNGGTCTWTTSYDLVFVSGDRMGGAAETALPRSVAPGQTIDLSIGLTAPEANGSYRGYWKLRNSSGQLFGIGASAATAFWVDIRVRGKTHIAYDFAANYCDADWENNNASLPCPGDEGDEAGYVVNLAHPRLESGASQGEPGLLMVPRETNNGLIRGQFPSFTVETGDRFRAWVYCRYGASKCNVTMRLDYLNDGQIRTLGTWHEAYEGKYFPVDLDLSSLNGQTLKFILVVLANGSAVEDEAIWLGPHILRLGAPPPPTHTPTPSPTATATATATATNTATETATTAP